ncbi:MAG: phenylalanine--tRNA ligase subunit alpha [bacterium]|nr:phenylalanine--tRNA ligase subunit alpha [Candidatus Wildermuthbacteria bacterium]MDP2664619.1 phenylalanine--tRNA ligase subunit alpha [bacterium]
MASSVKALQNKAGKAFLEAKNRQELEGIFKQYLGPKGELTLILRSLGKLSKQKRVKLGKDANETKNALLELFEAQEKKLQKAGAKPAQDWLDITAPGTKIESGHLHPVTLVQRRAEAIFRSMGFEIAKGPEIESEWYNFDALNIAKDHPARDMWDTFWLKQPEEVQKQKAKSQRSLLRTHTSPVQIRYMETHQPPLRIISPGRCFRYEATDASHETNFYQLEGLMVGKDVTASNFKAVIQEFLSRLFAKPVAIRLRPTYFPFTEPSFEVDASCVICGAKGCSVCGGDGWLELMGAGMVHPNVLKAVGYNPKDWQGFAFGVGLDRLAMLKYKVNDLRLFFSGDLRFLQQF